MDDVAPAPAVDELADLYDDETLGLIDAGAEAPRYPGAVRPADTVPSPTSAVRRGAAGLAMTAAVLNGVGDALEPEADEAFEEIEDSHLPDRDAFVTLVYVPNDPWATRAIVRPWLAFRTPAPNLSEVI